MAKMPLVHIFTKFSHQNLKLLLCTKLQSLRKTVTLASVLKLSTGTCRLDSMDTMPSILFIVLLSPGYLYILLSAYNHIAQETKKTELSIHAN